MDFFDRICNEVTDGTSLETYLGKNIGDFWELFYSNHSDLLECVDKLEEFVLLKYGYISQLDFSKMENKSFVAALLDICLRLNVSSPVPILWDIIAEGDIKINSRIEAGLSYICPKPSSADAMIGLCGQICEKLKYAIDYEEDDDSKSIATFLCYYAAAIDSLHPSKVCQLKNVIESFMDSGTYPFLDKITVLRDIDPNATETAYQAVHELIDSYYEGDNRQHIYENENRQENSRSENKQPTHATKSADFLIEENTDYSRMLRALPNCNFEAIRNIAVSRNSMGKLSGRGVEIIENEMQLYTYLKNYGNMHKAKMLSAMESPFPQKFDGPVTIVDWGCGQALATMVFIDKYGSNCVENIVLVEPSVVALKRASLHCSCMAPNSKIKTVNKKLDDVVLSDIYCSEQNTTIHLFSNILDLDDYSVKKLVELLDQNNGYENYYVCVSPYIDDIKAGKIEHFVNHFKNKTSFELINSKTNTKSGAYWLCNNSYRYNGMRHGGNAYCGSDRGTNGCGQRWTRILRVFRA